MAASVIGMRLTVYIRFGFEQGYLFAIPVHFQHALETVVVGAVLPLDAGEDELVIGELDAIAGLHPQVLLDAVVLGAGDADDADREPHVPQDHGPVAVAERQRTPVAKPCLWVARAQVPAHW